MFNFYCFHRNEENLETKIDSLAKEIISQAGSDWTLEETGSARPKIADVRPSELHNQVSRAFEHCITGKFLAESGMLLPTTYFHLFVPLKSG